MRRRYRADAVLRFMMLAVSAALMLAWFYKALTIKDNLLGRGTLQGDGSETTEEEIRTESEPQPRAESQPEPLRSALARGIVAFLLGRNPLFRFMAEETMAPEPVTSDPDPAYAGYLARQRLVNESWYLALYGDENSLAGFWGPPEAGTAEETGPNGAAQGLTGPGNGANAPGQESAGSGQRLAGSGQESDGAVLGGLPGQPQEGTAFRRMTSLTPAYHRRDGLAVTGTAYVLEQLCDFDFLMQNFYSVHASTTAGREEIDAAALLARDLSIDRETDQPQILIYHTHSQETFCDYGPGNPEATVVGIGTRLTELLQNKGYKVIHDTTAYDIMNGELDRNHAYNYALDGITAILQENPSIQVVLDIHRDGVNESVRLVTEIDGKPTARIMFFNGMSQTPEGPIEYLPNPCREDNLAFSLQMQLDAAAYYPGLTRKIYLKGLRYNLHVRPRSALIEVGAQTNTYEEALNAMEPLAELLDMTLGGQRERSVP